MFTLYIEDIHGGQTHEHGFGEGELIIGRSRDKCDIVLPADNISRRHARLYTAEGRCFVQDLNSSNGVLVDGTRIRDIREIEPSTRLRIGDYVLYITSDAAPPPTAASEYGRFRGVAGNAGQVFGFRDAVALIGRGKDTAVTVIDASVSRIHAKLTVTQAGEFVLQDLKSSNGTHVNDQRIEQCVVRHQDRVRFGSTEFVFEVAGLPTAEETPVAAPEPVSQPAAQPVPQIVEQPAPAQEWGEMEPQGSSWDHQAAAAMEYDDAPAQRGGKPWLIIVIIVLLLAAVGGVTTVLLMDRGPSEEEIAAEKARIEQQEKEEEEREREERRKKREQRQIAEDLEIATGHLEALEWDAASAALDRVALLDPENAEVKKGRELIQKEKPNEAKLAAAKDLHAKRKFGQALKAFAELPEDSVYAKEAQDATTAIKDSRPTLVGEGDKARKSREWETAFDRYTEALEIDPDDPVVKKHLKRVRRKLRR